mgnify:CR=1 FL=1
MIYKVRVKLNKDFIKINGKEITIGVMRKPEKGKANMEIIKKISKSLDIPSSRVRILSGFSSRNKVIEVL